MLLGQLISLVFVIGGINVSSCAAFSTVSSETVFVGSMPGGAEIKSMLGIDAAKPVDFIRWHLVLREHDNSFVMNARYGVGKPNTPDFEGGGEKSAFEGRYAVAKDESREVYTLTSSKMPRPISMIKINDNFLHILTPEKKLMAGNGGWSYSLSRKDVSSLRAPAMVSFESTAESPIRAVYDGRTPCKEIAKEYGWQTGDSCFKLKWRLTLYRDSKTGKPTTYSILRTLHRAVPIEGKWTIVAGTKTDPKAVVYRLDPDKADRSLSFLVGDENVLFFMDKDGRLYGANADFSYVLNRRNE